MAELKSAGAFGSARSIHTAFRGMMVSHDAAVIIKMKADDGKIATHYRITNEGMISLGHFPAKRETTDAHKEPPVS
jgi:hypothetical protein